MQNIHLKIETGVHTSSINKFAITSDGSYFVSSAQDKTIRVWDPIAQKEVRKFLGAIGPGDYGNVQGFVITPDDQYVISNVRRVINGSFNDAIRIFDFETGELIKQFETGVIISAVSVSQDNQMIAVGHFDDCTVHLWELSTFLAADSYSLDDQATHFQFPHQDQPYFLEIFKSKDDYLTVTSVANFHNGQHYLSLYSFEENDFLVEKIPYPDAAPTTIAYNHQHIAVNHFSKKIDIYDHQLNLIQELPAACHHVAYSPNGRLLIRDFGGADQCTVYDAANNYEVVSKLGQYHNAAKGVGFLNNLTAVTGGGNLNEIHFWNPYSGEERGFIPGVGQADFAVGINGTKIAFGNTQQTQPDQNNFAPIEKQFDLNDLLEDSFHIDEINLDEIDHFKRAVTERDNLKAYIQVPGYNLRTNEGFLSGTRGIWYYAETFGLTENNLIVTGNRGGHGYCAMPDGSYLAQFKGHNNTVWDLAIDGNRMVTCSEDQIIRIWNLDEIPTDFENHRGKRPEEAKEIMPMLNIFITKDDEWIVWSNSGFYSASLYGDSYIGYHVNQGEDKEALFFPSDRFVDSLYRPDVIKEIVKTGSEAQALANLDIDIQQIQDILPAQIEVGGKEILSTDQEEYQLTFKLVLSNDQPITKIVVFNNEQPVWQQLEQNITQSTTLTTEKIHLFPGENQLKILAYGEHSRSLPKIITVNRIGDQMMMRGDKSKTAVSDYKVVPPNLYLLAVGVSEYKHHGKHGLKNLRWAHNDAIEFGTYFGKQQGRAFKKVEKFILANKGATKAKILTRLGDLKDKIIAREKEKKDNKWISRDVFMVFLAGHGYKIENSFYFIAQDTNPEPANFKSSALLITEIGNIMNEVSTEFVIITDACHSGAAGGEFNTLEFTKRWLATHDRAQLLFNATMAEDLAAESKFKKHGYFTLGILDELKSSKKSTAIQLCHKVSERVRVSRGDKQTPTVTVYGSLVDYEIFK